MPTKYRLWLPLCAAALLSVSLPRHSSAQSTETDPQPASGSPDVEFIRVAKSGDRLQALQTAIARFQKQGNRRITVDLVGAVHIGEASYYRTLNELFQDYDVVLYELVAPEGTRIPAGAQGRSSNPISFLQTSAQNFLGLESQLAKIDYTRDNFKHADLSPSELKMKLQERGESTWSVALSTLTELLNDPHNAEKPSNPRSDFSFGDFMEMVNNPLKAKQFVAQQMGAMGNMEKGLGSKLTQLIVDDRNEAAMQVLQEVLEQGHQKVAIFYGAAHMPDFQERLAKQDFHRVSQSWLTAWDLTRSHAQSDNSTSPFSMLRRMMQELDN